MLAQGPIFSKWYLTTFTLGKRTVLSHPTTCANISSTPTGHNLTSAESKKSSRKLSEMQARKIQTPVATSRFFIHISPGKYILHSTITVTVWGSPPGIAWACLYVLRRGMDMGCVVWCVLGTAHKKIIFLLPKQQCEPPSILTMVSSVGTVMGVTFRTSTRLNLIGNYDLDEFIVLSARVDVTWQRSGATSKTPEENISCMIWHSGQSPRPPRIYVYVWHDMKGARQGSGECHLCVCLV